MVNMDVKKEKVVKILKITLISIIFVMMLESLMMIEYIDTPLFKDISKWNEKINNNYLCDSKKSECSSEWRQWLSIGDI